MTGSLSSSRHRVAGFAKAQEFALNSGWSDGLPIIPPTEPLVREFLEYAGLEPDAVVAEIPERARLITAEKVAINAVMAGCLPEHMPVIVAALEAVADPLFKFNHLASLASPWPLIIVNGPYAKKIGINSGAYLFGPGSRPNATIARAVSLVLRNCADAKIGGVQMGAFGNPMRWGGCMAENEDTAWEPLQVHRGFDRETSTVTVVSIYPGPCHVGVMLVGERPERILDPICDFLASYSGVDWVYGVFTLIVGPHIAKIFSREGWSKDDVRRYIFENTRSSIANLKQRAAWGQFLDDVSDEMQRIEPGDESKFLYLFKDNGELDRYVFTRSMVEGRLRDVFVLVAGPDAGYRVAVTFPYMNGSSPATKAIKTSR